MKLRIPGFFRKDLPRKVVAVFFAALIWFAVRSQIQDTATFHSIPIDLQYKPGDITIEDRVLTVDITLRGSTKRL